MSDKRAVVEETVETTVEETVVERPYTLRRLKDSDLYPLLQILRKIGIKDMAKEAFADVDTSGDAKSLKDRVEEIGASVVFNMADLLIENIGKVSEDLYSMWSDISGIPAEEIKDMEFGTLPLMIYDSFAEVKNTAFFKVLFKLL